MSEHGTPGRNVSAPPLPSRRELLGMGAALLCARAANGGPSMDAPRQPRMAEPIGLDALFDLDRLPVLRSGTCGLVSSYNRRSWNGDDQPEFLRIEGAEQRAKDLMFYTWAEGERVDDLPVEAACQAGRWRHVAVTWDLSDDGMLAKCAYVDGVLVAQRTVANWKPAEHRAAFPREADDRLFVGSQVGGCWLRGALADVRVYDRPLPRSEVAAARNGQPPAGGGLMLHLPGTGPGASHLQSVAGRPDELEPGPDGRGLRFPEGRNLAYQAAGRLTPRRGTFAAWVNPAELAEGQMQHLFCLGADSLGLYLVPGTAGGEGVLAELNGPGCIYRTWLGGGAGRTLHFYFDGEARPRVSLRFSGQHGEPDFGAARWLPLTSGAGDLCYPPMMATGVANGPYLETGISYVPMPFRRSCKITLAPAGSKYVQVNYHLFPAGTTVTTFDPHNISPRDLAVCRAGRERWWHPAPCAPATAVRAAEEARDVTLTPGQSAQVVHLPGAGRVTGLWVRVPEGLRTEEVLRGVRLRLTWDGASAPQVDAPLGPFFNDAYGTPSEANPIPLSPDIRGAVPDAAEQARWAFGLPHEMRGLVLGWIRDAGYYCFLPMPFAADARLELENTASVAVPVHVVVRWEAWSSLPANLGRFHARYQRENPTAGIDDPRQVRPDFTGKASHVILEQAGRGHYVGASLFFRKVRPLKPEVERLVGDICEGNEMIFVDDDPALTMIGTGSEDYINQNYWVHDHVYPYDGSRHSYDACYRFHVSDCVPFRKRIRVTIEHGAGNAHYLDYSSVAYWYQAPG